MQITGVPNLTTQFVHMPVIQQARNPIDCLFLVDRITLPSPYLQIVFISMIYLKDKAQRQKQIL